MVWSSPDALVLKWVALTVGSGLDVHPACLHLQDGAHRAVRKVAEQLLTGRWCYVYRTDIRGYYRHIRKTMAWRVWQEHVRQTVCLNVIQQYLYYSTETGGEIHTPVTGISRGCALSPLTGAILLRHMDRFFYENKDIFYVRYMDDFLVLAEKRWPLRRAIADLNGYLHTEGFERHPDKTQTGRLARGFDGCGIDFTAGQPVRISDRSMEKHRDRCRRLDEQLRAAGYGEEAIRGRVQAYVTRWQQWADSLLRMAR